MNNWQINQRVDLAQGPASVTVWPKALMVVGDGSAHEWRVEVVDKGKPAELTGNVTGYFIRIDGATVPIKGKLEGNVASVVLDSTCYAYEGDLRGILRISDGSSVVTLSALLFRVTYGTTDEIVDPGDVIPSLDELLQQIENIKQATSDANTAAGRANTEADAANKAAAAANASISNVDEAVEKANTAASNADTATERANAAASGVEAATQRANDAADRVDDSIQAATEAAQKIDGLTVSAHEVQGEPTADVTTVEDHYNIDFGLVKGPVYVPSVTDEGDLSWSVEDAPVEPIETVNIKGPQGDKGDKGEKGDRGDPGPAGTGTGDMLASIYDPQEKQADIFDYIDKAVKNVTVELPDHLITGEDTELPPVELGLDADTLQGHSASYFATAAALTAQENDELSEAEINAAWDEVWEVSA